MTGLAGINLVVARRSPQDRDRRRRWQAADATAVITAPAAGTSLAPLTRALLESVGKDPTVRGGAAATIRTGWPLVPVWLIAGRYRRLIVDEAQLLPARHLEAVILLAAATNVDLWLVARPRIPDRWLSAVAYWPARRRAITDIPTRPPVGTAPVLPQIRFPGVPSSDIPWFRVDCKATLPPAGFEVVDAVFRDACNATVDWGHRRRRAGGRVDAEPVAGFIRSQVSTTSSTDRALTVLRGCAVGALRLGVLVTADGAAFRAATPGEPWFAAADPAAGEALNRFRQPYRPAAYALAACGWAITEMLSLRVGDLGAVFQPHDPPQSAARRDGALPEWARQAVHAQILWRRISGASDSDPLFVNAAGAPVRPRYLRDAIVDMREGGLLGGGRRVRRQRVSHLAWAARLHIRVRSLDDR